MMRHSPEGRSELFQERQQFVVGLKAFGSPFYRVGFGQGLFFQCEVSVEIFQMCCSTFDLLCAADCYVEFVCQVPSA
jgi:hypothetical protein